MNFYIDESSRRNECFGWWVSDMVDILKVQKVPKPDASVSRTCGQQSQLASEESLTTSHQLDKTDVNQITFDYKDNTTINVNSAREGNVSCNTVYNTPVLPITVSRSRKITVKEENTFDNSTFSKPQLAALINPHLPNYEQLENVLNRESRNKTSLTKLRQLKIATESNRSTKCLSDLKARLQNDWTSQVDEDHKGLSPYAKLALSIEQDPDRNLEEPRCALLQAFRGLNSRLKALQEDARQLQVDINRLQRDFQLQESVVTQMNAETQQLEQDIEDTQYLDDLIFLLQGQLDRITLRKWPFLVGHVHQHTDANRELNLIV